MSTTGIIPVANLGDRMQEQGRIRLGVKTAKAMKAIDTFRFTSPDREAIEQIAEIYGGTVEPWTEPKANPPVQWQVTTTSTELRVFLPRDALSTWYEQWTGGGCVRRCDGVTVSVTTRRGDDSDTKEVPCLCIQQNHRQCEPHTRLQVILPEIRFGGVWRLETKGWTAAHEMPAMEAMISQLQGVGILEGVLSLEQAQSQGGRKKFVVPRLRLATNALQMLEGMANVGALHSGQANAPALGTGALPVPELPVNVDPPTKEWFEDDGNDDEIVDAEIIEDASEPAAEVPAESVGQEDGAKASEPGNVTPATDAPAASDVPAEIQPPSDREAAKNEKASAKQQTKVILAAKDAAAQCGIDETFLRHALCRKASQGRTASSRELTKTEASDVIDWCLNIEAGTITATAAEGAKPKVVLADRRG